MKITTPERAFHYFKNLLSREVEEFWALALNSEKAVLAQACLFRGTVNGCLFHPRDVFRFAYRHNASSLIVAHNHPTGESWPSPQDRGITRQLWLAAEILQLPVEDHLILGRTNYFSFLQAGELTTSPTNPAAPDDPSLR